ncbi:chemotaxis protein CheW [Alsobacter soli]|uniref:Chemotaxis protein CheW n=1 Tax=Alsobacter soli TaxID=2109933 RepID=A0A2T1HQC4_9HYPH|nr:chemotaxis protein CheW [Alsobacter soli]PSC03861.1 chemotaxis protein CheW [Alsobacter soli]
MTDEAPLPQSDRRARILDERTRELARRRIGPRAAAAHGEAHLVCSLGRNHVGLPVASVAGVLPAKPCTPVPGAPPAVLGVFGHEGRTATAADLATALGVARAANGDPGGAGVFVMLKGADPRLALRVDSVQTVEPLAASEPAEAMGRDGGSAFAVGYAPLATPSGPAIVTLLDAERLVRSLLSPSPAPGA